MSQLNARKRWPETLTGRNLWTLWRVHWHKKEEIIFMTSLYIVRYLRIHDQNFLLKVFWTKKWEKDLANIRCIFNKPLGRAKIRHTSQMTLISLWRLNRCWSRFILRTSLTSILQVIKTLSWIQTLWNIYISYVYCMTFTSTSVM